MHINRFLGRSVHFANGFGLGFNWVHGNGETTKTSAILAATASVPATGQQGVPRPRRKPVTTPARWPNEPDERTALQREIAEWNAAVDRRKAEKKLGRSA